MSIELMDVWGVWGGEFWKHMVQEKKMIWKRNFFSKIWHTDAFSKIWYTDAEQKEAEILTFDASADHFYPIFNTRAVLPRNCFRELLDDLTT